MARDLDFRRQPARPTTPAPVPSRPQKSVPIREKTTTTTMKSSRTVGWLAFIAVLFFAAIAVGLYYQSLQGPSKKVTTPTEEAPQEQPQKLVVKVYDGGGGTEAVDAVATLLTEKGYTIEKSGKTQFEYDKTYIWYIDNFASDATAIGETLTTRQTVLKESKISGSFGIQIHVGKQ